MVYLTFLPKNSAMKSHGYDLKPFTRLCGFVTLFIISLFIKNSFSTDAWTSEIWYPLSFIAGCGSLYGLIERSLNQRPIGEKPIFYVVYNDLRLANLTTGGIISAVYSVCYGGIIGISIFGISLSISNRFALPLSGLNYTLAMLLISLMLLFLLIPIRIAAESYAVLFKVAQKYLNENSG